MKKKVSIIGGGAAAITLAAFLDDKKFSVTIYERNKALGRKFLVAGKGGFNLTHSEPIEGLIERYTPTNFLIEAITHFSNNDLREWLESMGIPTYVGSSKRVYPKKGIKPIEVLQAIQKVLSEKGVAIRYNTFWTGWDSKNSLVFDKKEIVESDIVVFSMGGGSWKVTGSDGHWLEIFKQKGIGTTPFLASNCGYNIEWAKDFIAKHAGSPLKNISISLLDKERKGEVVVTKFGLEGNAIYALSPQIRAELKNHKTATITIDLKTTLTYEEVLAKLANSNTQKVTDLLKKDLKLSPVQIGLLKAYSTKEEFLSIDILAQKIKALPLTIINAAELDEAISTVGGVSLTEVDKNFQLKALENSYCIGEQLDWDAPTGGYLLQACFSMGFNLAQHLNE